MQGLVLCLSVAGNIFRASHIERQEKAMAINSWGFCTEFFIFALGAMTQLVRASRDASIAG